MPCDLPFLTLFSRSLVPVLPLSTQENTEEKGEDWGLHGEREREGEDGVSELHW